MDRGQSPASKVSLSLKDQQKGLRKIQQYLSGKSASFYYGEHDLLNIYVAA
jgi:hypothetical protein